MAELPREVQKDNQGQVTHCDHCETDSEATPIMTYVFQGEEKKVCVHCLPMLIHG